jgi:hypothetical protein
VAEIVTIRGDQEFLAVAERLLPTSREEIVCAVRDLRTWSSPRVREAARARMRMAQPTAHQARKLFSSATLADKPGREELRQLASHGLRVRIATAPLPHEAIIVDRRAMIVAGDLGPGGREYTVTSSPTLIDSMYTLFEAAWDAATDLDAALRGDLPALAPQHRAILRTLGSGATDETAAKELGMSLRTYRRRVAELLTALDATTRFQAGLRAATLGLTH